MQQFIVHPMYTGGGTNRASNCVFAVFIKKRNKLVSKICNFYLCTNFCKQAVRKVVFNEVLSKIDLNRPNSKSRKRRLRQKRAFYVWSERVT